MEEEVITLDNSSTDEENYSDESSPKRAKTSDTIDGPPEDPIIGEHNYSYTDGEPSIPFQPFEPFEHDYFAQRANEVQEYDGGWFTKNDKNIINLPLQSCLVLRANSNVVFKNLPLADSDRLTTESVSETSVEIDLGKVELNYVKMKPIKRLARQTKRNDSVTIGMGKTMRPQAREVIKNVYNYFLYEKRVYPSLIPLHKIHERISAATGLDLEVVEEILRKTVSPKSTRKNQRRKRGRSLNNAATSLCAAMNRLFRENKQIPIENLLKHVENETRCCCTMAQLLRLLKNFGYFCRKSGNKLLIYNSKRLADWQLTYIRQMKELRESGRPIFYLDETWFGPGYTSNCAWIKVNSGTNDDEVGWKKQAQRLLVAHVGNENGFVEGAECLYIPTKKITEWNGERFEEWVTNTVFPRLPENFVVVLHNARWHCRRLHKCPTSNAGKKEMTTWLDKKGVSYDPEMDKNAFYDKYVLPNKNKNVDYIVDRLAAERGGGIVRLPPGHRELNPFHVVWSVIRARAVKDLPVFEINAFKRNVADEFTRFSADLWKLAIEKVIATETLYYPDLNAGNFLKPLVILLNNPNVVAEETAGDPNFDVNEVSNESFTRSSSTNSNSADLNVSEALESLLSVPKFELEGV